MGYLFLKGKALVYFIFHLRDFVLVARLRKRYEGIQLKMAEILKIYRAIHTFEACNMLIFGLGNDSPFWRSINGKGRTVFLEDFKPWFEKITEKYPGIEAYQITYPLNITQWKEVLDQEEKLALELPSEITSQSWDVILVDGPRGQKYAPEIPGRMSSIYMASRLVASKGYVFVHDAERSLEKTYAQHFLGKEHFTEKVRGRALLLVYRF